MLFKVFHFVTLQIHKELPQLVLESKTFESCHWLHWKVNFKSFLENNQMSPPALYLIQYFLVTLEFGHRPFAEMCKAAEPPRASSDT